MKPSLSRLLNYAATFFALAALAMAICDKLGVGHDPGMGFAIYFVLAVNCKIFAWAFNEQPLLPRRLRIWLARRAEQREQARRLVKSGAHGYDGPAWGASNRPRLVEFRPKE